jgi:hypothetical protein
MRSSAMVESMVLITATGHHDRPDWMITFTGIRRLGVGSLREAATALMWRHESTSILSAKPQL